MNEVNDTGSSRKTKQREVGLAKCEACAATLDPAKKAGLFRMGWEQEGATVYTRPILLCPKCWRQANRERPAFLRKSVVAELVAEARLLGLVVPREFWARFQ